MYIVTSGNLHLLCSLESVLATVNCQHFLFLFFFLPILRLTLTIAITPHCALLNVEGVFHISASNTACVQNEGSDVESVLDLDSVLQFTIHPVLNLCC